jgi:hypothetical protein
MSCASRPAHDPTLGSVTGASLLFPRGRDSGPDFRRQEPSQERDSQLKRVLVVGDQIEGIGTREILDRPSLVIGR